MINLTPTQVGGIATLMVMFEITNQAETQRVINQLNQIAKLNGITVNINLKTKSGSSKAMATKSMIKPPVIPDMAISGVLEAADSAIPNLEWYKSNPVGKPYRARIQSAQSPMRQIVQSEFRKRDKQGGSAITSRSQYMKSANKSLNGVMKGNDIYSQWVSMITK